MRNFRNERCVQILETLLSTMKPVTTKTLSLQLKVSNKTVRNDLLKIEEFLSEHNYGKLEKKPRIGIWIDATEEGKFFLKDLLNKQKAYNNPFTSEERHLHIIKSLLQANDAIKMQVLANELYVSRVTVHKDLKDVEEWLNKYNLKLKRRQNYGIEIIGNEKEWRKVVSLLLSILKDKNEFKGIIINPQDINYHPRIGHENYIQIKDLFPDINIRIIEEILMEAEKNMEFSLADDGFDSLVAHIAISLERLKQKKDIKMNVKQLSVIVNHKEFEVAKRIAQRLEEEFNLKIPESEIGYISLHILGSKVHHNFDSTIDLINNTDQNILQLAREIASLVGNILSVDLTRDEKLTIGLILHLRPALNRLKYELNLKNPLLKEIKQNYPSIFGASWATSVLFEKIFSVKVNEEEIGYISIHIGAALERLNKKVKAIVVCTSGVGTSQLVAVRLENTITDLEILDIVSSYDISKTYQVNFDIIISTVSLRHVTKPIIKISPFVSDSDISRIKEAIKNIKKARRSHKEELDNTLFSLMDESLIFMNLSPKNYNEVIKTMGKTLIERGYVEPRFTDDCLAREKITSTAVGNMVAIPHTVQDYVMQPAVALAILKEPIQWGESKVDIVLMLALKFESGSYTRDFFRKFYSIISDVKILNEIRSCQTPKSIYDIFTRGSVTDE